jgi:hypothetical protein
VTAGTRPTTGFPLSRPSGGTHDDGTTKKIGQIVVFVWTIAPVKSTIVYGDSPSVPVGPSRPARGKGSP